MKQPLTRTREANIARNRRTQTRPGSQRYSAFAPEQRAPFPPSPSAHTGMSPKTRVEQEGRGVGEHLARETALAFFFFFVRLDFGKLHIVSLGL